LQLLNRNKGQCGLNALKKFPKSNKLGENNGELSRHEVLNSSSNRANTLIRKLKLSADNIHYFTQRCRDYNIRDLRELKDEKISRKTMAMGKQFHKPFLWQERLRKYHN
jgi:hypothetical protein